MLIGSRIEQVPLWQAHVNNKKCLQTRHSRFWLKDSLQLYTLQKPFQRINWLKNSELE